MQIVVAKCRKEEKELAQHTLGDTCITVTLEIRQSIGLSFITVE